MARLVKQYQPSREVKAHAKKISLYLPYAFETPGARVAVDSQPRRAFPAPAARCHVDLCCIAVYMKTRGDSIAIPRDIAAGARPSRRLSGGPFMSNQDRPLSPHLLMYRPQLTSVLSITHRMTGVGLTAGTLLLVYWLVAAAAGEAAFETARGVIGSFIGRLFLFGWSFALFYHLCNGIRHMLWDLGYCLELPALYRSGWVMLAAAVALTLASWIAGYAAMGSL
jgi:succinate dehydrogenase / fumarate reductase cytochrome b subunit